MADEPSPNKITDKMERRADHIKERLEEQGMGRDHAAHESLRRAVAEDTSGGGANSGGDPKQGHNHERDNRRGGDKNP